MAKPELGPFLAVEFQHALAQPDVSFDVHWHLEHWRRRLPAPPPDLTAAGSMKELDELVRRLDDDSYARRVGAAERLDWLLGNPKLIYPVLFRLKQRLADVEISNENRRQIEAACQRARKAWLLSDPAGWELPAVSDEQIGRWLDDLAAPCSPGKPAEAWRSKTAERELLDLLAYNACVPRVAKAVRERMARKPSADAAARLMSLLDWTKPEIVAEIWMMPRRRFSRTGVVTFGRIFGGRIHPLARHAAAGPVRSRG